MVSLKILHNCFASKNIYLVKNPPFSENVRTCYTSVFKVFFFIFLMNTHQLWVSHSEIVYLRLCPYAWECLKLGNILTEIKSWPISQLGKILQLSRCAGISSDRGEDRNMAACLYLQHQTIFWTWSDFIVNHLIILTDITVNTY